MTERSCPDCGVQPGQPHEEGCDVARCLYTGMQRLSCDNEDHDDCGGDIWSGIRPGRAECEEFGWWVQDRCSEGLGFVPCAPGAPGAIPALNRLAVECDWDRDAKRWRRRSETGASS